MRGQEAAVAVHTVAQCRRDVLGRRAELNRADLRQPLVVLFAELDLEGAGHPPEHGNASRSPTAPGRPQTLSLTLSGNVVAAA